MRYRIVICFVFLAAFSAHAQTTENPPVDPVWRPETFVLQEKIGDVDVSADGSVAVWVVRRPTDQHNRLVGQLHLGPLDGVSKNRVLTGGSFNVSKPRLSPDANRVAFLSDRSLAKDDRDGSDTVLQTQVWLTAVDGGEPRALTKMIRGVGDFAWLDDDSLVVLAPPGPDLRARSLEKDQDDSEVVEDITTWVPVRLWTVSIDDGKTTPLTSNNDVIDVFSVDRVHRRVAARHLPDPHWEADHRGTPRFTLNDLSSGVEQEIQVTRDILPEHLAFTADGSTLLAVFLQTSRPDLLAAGRSRAAYWQTGTASWQVIDSPEQVELLDLVPTVTGAFLRLAEGAETRLTRLERTADGFEIRGLTGDAVRHIDTFAVSADGTRLVVEQSRASLPPQLWIVGAKGSITSNAHQLTFLNSDLRGKPIAATEVVSWTGAGGEKVEGLLYRPTRKAESGPAPLVVMIHGGPASADRDLWDEDWASAANAYCQRGAWVLKPNYHGSTGYGQSFAESIAGRYYELEVPDILAGIDSLVARGLVDPERVGLVGWSNGAILAISLGLERPFAAIVAGAGDVNWTSDFGNCAFGAWFDRYYIGGEPWTDAEGYLAKSPLFRLHHTTSPTLILFGAEDTSVPTSQGWEHYRALQQSGRAPVRFVLFPGEPHSLKNLIHQRRKLTEELAWMDRHLFGRAPAQTPVLPRRSVLRAAHLAAKLDRNGSLVGTADRDGGVVPQTARVAALPMLEVGLTEVTVAQWARFTGESVPAGTANLPATITDTDLVARYCRWLQKRTGRRWRALTETENRRLRDACRETIAVANTLDAWAGTELTRDDAEPVRAMALQTPGATGMLRPVTETSVCTIPVHRAGPWDPEATVFGLDGNLAEHVENGDGPRVAGGSAFRARAETEGPPVDGEVIGLRLAVEIMARTQ